MAEEEEFVLSRSRFTSVFRVNDLSSHWYGDGYEIHIGGFVLDALGGVLFSEILCGARTEEELLMLRNTYRPYTLHWLEAETFVFADRTIDFLHPKTTCVEEEKREEIAAFFPVFLRHGGEPDRRKGEFLYAGKIFREGRGSFHGFPWWQKQG
jgi:hypothetical protein